MIDALLKAGATVSAFDPEAMPNVKKLMGDKIRVRPDEYEALEGADALIIATEWALFRTPDFKRMERALKEKVIFDGRNLYDLDEMKELGFTT
jgi:UDPglucose 6-dehydrogenase